MGRLSGVRKAKDGRYRLWVRSEEGDGPQHVVLEHDCRDYVEVVRSMCDSLTCGGLAFLPDPDTARSLRHFEPGVYDRMCEICDIDFDPDVLDRLYRQEEQQRIRDEVDRALRDQERLLRRRMGQKGATLIISRRDTEYYPDVPNARLPATDQGDGLPEQSGVYFVWGGNDRIEYVGQSVNIKARCTMSHENISAGDWIGWLPFDFGDMLYAESYYIGILRPSRNFQMRQKRLEERVA